ncbi:hypothetical protein [Bifidobacterium simiiventris]|uniref:hypothetical protein n=1 Tax=Bifidobacterium simiiventris TaxID=2834434 RepID=UPI001C5A2583|nr:hypothetical protein [Bifidobacterium simiiventris]MBW3078664.1 hypothetical protein [Bifidobacterium simiiventris]
MSNDNNDELTLTTPLPAVEDTVAETTVLPVEERTAILPTVDAGDTKTAVLPIVGTGDGETVQTSVLPVPDAADASTVAMPAVRNGAGDEDAEMDAGSAANASDAADVATDTTTTAAGDRTDDRHAAADAASSIPLYTAARPQPASAAAAPSGPGAGDPRRPSTNPPYAQMPDDSTPPATAVVRRTGPSAATITLGVCVLVLGVLSVLLGAYFPLGWVIQTWTLDPRIAAAIMFAGFGGVLVLVAVIWSLATMLHGRKRDKR